MKTPERKSLPLGLRIIGKMKLVTALLLATAAFGAFRLIHKDMGDVLEQYVTRLHLDPENRWINQLLESLAGVDAAHLKAISAGTFFYSLLYAIEGIGLLRGKRWAEYLVVIITGSLLPLEIYEIDVKISLIRIGVLLINVMILMYLIRQLRRGSAHHRQPLQVSG